MSMGRDFPPETLNVIKTIGLNVVTEITLLGMPIDNKLEKLAVNFTKVRDRIVNQISFWEQYKLSLPSRISVAKTFMVSQLNYSN
jgi:hypothetical protein